MINTTIKMILQAILIFGFGFALGEETVLKNNFVDLDIQEGQGSLLLSWNVPDTLSIAEIRLFSKTSYYDDFTHYEIVEQGKRKYLDTSCEEKERYFYYIELIDLFGRTITSDINHPTFGTCLQKESNPFIDEIDPDRLETLFKLKQVKMIHSLMPNLDSEIISSLVDLFYRKSLNDFDWCENLLLSDLPNIENDFLTIHSYYTNIQFSDSIHIYKEYLQNEFFLIGEEWNVLEKEIESRVMNNMNQLLDQYINNLDFLHTVDAIRIVQKNQFDNNNYVSLLVIREQDISWDELYLLNGDTYINILKPEEREPNQLIEVMIPTDWTFATLVHNGEWVQNIRFIPDVHKMSISLMNEYFIPDNDQVWKVAIEKPSSTLNEIHYANNILQFEIMSHTDQFESYTLWSNNDILFEWSPPLSAEPVFIDTSLIISNIDSADIQWIRWCRNTNQDLWKNFEWIPIDISQEIHLEKLPDGGQWEETSNFSLGKSNTSENLFESESLIPEIFVLYQNYPNPFNSETRISFDLLENATVSLFIFDANGRIIDQFVESEFLQSGAYNFSWNATGHPTGIYFFTIQTMVNGLAPVTFSRKMIYLK
ncbi:MAG: T9SS type A sorting domain-containing protein [Candidatus Marinimicrobia bacterium]|nr:T9SS type A sorting domain-containing protein [Candidatus Neomarinimicrobiota bacterium]